MANLMLTTVCTRQCAYCFAASETGGHASWSLVEDFVRWIRLSGVTQLRLIGGEPSLYPRFKELIELAGDLEVVIFSNGDVPTSARETLAAAPNVRLVLNVAAPEDQLPGEADRMALLTTALPDRVMPGFNIYNLPVRADSVLPLYDRYPLVRRLRVGLAAPTADAANCALHPRHYPEVGRRVGALALAAADIGVQLELDCGFVRCMFDDDAANALEQSGATWASHCSPTLDLLLDGVLISCFGVGRRETIQFDPSVPADEFRARFSKRVEPWRRAGIYPECTSCKVRERGACTGGCLSWTRRFTAAPDEVFL